MREIDERDCKNGWADTESLFRGRARENDAYDEAKAESICNMDVGCGTVSICYAEKMGRPEMCMKNKGTPMTYQEPLARIKQLTKEIEELANNREFEKANSKAVAMVHFAKSLEGFLWLEAHPISEE